MLFKNKEGCRVFIFFCICHLFCWITLFTKNRQIIDTFLLQKRKCENNDQGERKNMRKYFIAKLLKQNKLSVLLLINLTVWSS